MVNQHYMIMVYHSMRRKCKSDNDKTKAIRLAKALLEKGDKGFWKSIKSVCNTYTPLASTVDHATGGKEIVKMWHSHFKELLNSSVDRTGKAHVINTIQNHSDHYTRRFTPNDIAEILPQLKLRKSSGNDGIAGEHLRYAHDKITFYLSMLFNAMLIHGYMPQDLMDTILIPIVKDRKGVITDKNNYRPVAITSIISKILELLILKCYKSVFNTTANQFGF